MSKSDFWICIVSDGMRQTAQENIWTDKKGFTRTFDTEADAYAELEKKGLDEEGYAAHIKLKEG